MKKVVKITSGKFKDVMGELNSGSLKYKIEFCPQIILGNGSREKAYHTYRFFGKPYVDATEHELGIYKIFGSLGLFNKEFPPKFMPGEMVIFDNEIKEVYSVCPFFRKYQNPLYEIECFPFEPPGSTLTIAREIHLEKLTDRLHFLYHTHGVSAVKEALGK